LIEDAERALVSANNTYINGRAIRIEEAKENRTLYLGKLEM
jgi:hypothetical protein